MRGPGETQLEIDRREIHRRIAHAKDELEKVRAHRQRYREQRRRSNIPIVAIVGYTNAGKSTLLNKLANADVFVADQLFATLDPTTRRVDLPAGHTVLFTDTVGFIQKLPTQLIAAFRATLEEITEADLLVHVLDITHPNAFEQWKAVQQTLVDIGCEDIPGITALNKIDLLEDPQSIRNEKSAFSSSVAISARTGIGLPELLREVENALFENYLPITVFLPYREGQLISWFHEHGKVEETRSMPDYMMIKGSLPGRLHAQFHRFTRRPKPASEE